MNVLIHRIMHQKKLLILKIKGIEKFTKSIALSKLM
jgi:hypothetical protein